MAAIGELHYEFPDYDGDDVAALVAPLTPMHWHNDVCPSYGLTMGESDLRLWTDYAAPEKREDANGARFALTLQYCDGETIEAETWDAFVAALTAATPHCAPDAGVGVRAAAWACDLIQRSAWGAVEKAYPRDGGAWNDDDDGMRDAEDGQLVDWCADLEARVGLDVGDFRAALHGYMEARAVAQLTAAGMAPARRYPDGLWLIAGRAYSDILIEARDAALPACADGVANVGADDGTRSNGPRGGAL